MATYLNKMVRKTGGNRDALRLIDNDVEVNKKVFSNTIPSEPPVLAIMSKLVNIKI